MLLIPAIDLRGGRCVRLVQGDFGRELVYSAEPMAVATVWREQGARRLHVVDLDGARAGRPLQLGLVTAIAALGLPVQVGGGLRDAGAVTSAFAAGADRVIIGTSALTGDVLERCARAHPGRVWAGIDVDAGGRLRVAGWAEARSESPELWARRSIAAGAGGIVYTATARDGTLTGPDLPPWLERLGVPVIYAGGVGTVTHLAELARAGRGWLQGVVAGRALYDGTLMFCAGQRVLEEECAC